MKELKTDPKIYVCIKQLIKLHILNGFLYWKIKILRLYITVQGTSVIREK